MPIEVIETLEIDAQGREALVLDIALPVLALGPIAEQMSIAAGQSL